MISKIATNSLPFFNSLPRTTLFCLSSNRFRVNQQAVGGVERCFNIKDVLNYVSKSKELEESDFIGVCHRMLGLKYTMTLGDNYRPLSNQIQNLQIENCSLNLFVNACSVIPLMTGSDHILPTEIFVQVLERIKKEISEEPDRLNVGQLLHFLEVAILYDNKPLATNICHILSDKISEFKYRDQSRYLEIAGRAKLPSRGEKELFAKVSEKIEEGMERLDVRNLISYYKIFKNMNHKIYKTFNLGNKIEETIENNIDELEERDISSLVSFKSKSNIFLRIIHTKIIDSITDEGESPLEASTILALLSKITESGEIFCYENNFDKLLKLIERNINKDREIKRIIKNNYFTRSQLYKISRFICSLDDQQKSKYHSTYNYLYDLSSNFILDLDNYQHFLETTIEKNQVSFINERVIVSALIAEKLFNRYPDNAKIVEVREHFVNIIKETVKGVVRFNPFMLSKEKIAEEFTKQFWNIFYKNLFENVIKGEEKLKSNLFYFAILRNDLTTLNKLVELKKIPLSFIKNLINKVIANPEIFRANFNTINSIIQEYVKESKNLKIVFNYLCNWEVHGYHEASEVKSFFILAEQTIKNAKIKVDGFFTYLIESPQKSFKSSPAYYTFLFNYQEVLISRTKSEAKNYPIPFNFISELFKNKIISAKFAKFALENNLLKNEGFQKIIKTYCQILTKEKVNFEEIPINHQSLLLFARFSELSENMSKDKEAELLNALNEASLNDLEIAFLNLNLKKRNPPTGLMSLKKNDETLSFPNMLIKKYTSKLKTFRPSLLQIIKNAEKLSLKSEEYKKFLETVISIVTRNLDVVSMENLNILLNEANERSLPTSGLLSRVLGNIKLKARKNESIVRSLFPILDSCLIFCPQKTVEIFERVRNKTILNELFSNFELINIENPEIFKSVSTILSRNMKEKPSINIGVFEYLVSKNPKFGEFETRLALKNKNDNQCYWLRKELIKFLAAKEVSFEESEIKGFHVLKVGNKKFVFLRNNFSQVRKAKIEEIVSFLFQNEEEKGRVKVIFVGSETKPGLAHMITSEIPEIKKSFSEFLQAISNKNKERNASEELI